MRLKRYAELIWYKALSDLAAEAARAYIGILWWVVEPALYMAAFYIAFGSGIRGGGAHVMAFLLLGLVPWKWFVSSVSNCAVVLQSNSGLILQVYLPKMLLPFIVVVSNFIKFLIILTLLLLLVISLGFPLHASWFALPVVIFTEFLFILAVGSLVAGIVPLFPDLKLIVDNGLIVMMFVSGVFIDVHRMQPKMAALLEWNPMVTVLEGYRDILIKHIWPDWLHLGAVCLVSLLIYAVGFSVLKKFDRHYAKLMIA